MSYSIQGLVPNSDHALHVHENAACAEPARGTAPASGAVPEVIFSPGTPQAQNAGRLEGDLGNIHADSTGVATGFLVASTLALDGVRSIVGHTIVVHALPEDFYVPAEADTGAIVACGEVRP